MNRLIYSLDEKRTFIVTTNGSQVWLKNGYHHRINKPAIIFADGEEIWYKHGRLHRDNGPATINHKGEQEWFVDGILIKIVKVRK